MAASYPIQHQPNRWNPTQLSRVVKSDGRVMMYDRPINVSALVFEFPYHKICISESLYIGKKISALSEDDELQLGHYYFLLPIHFFDSALTFVTITSFAAALFEMQKTDSGFLKIRVREEFIFRLMEAAAKEDEKRKKMINNISRQLCTTPELWKEYKQLVLVKRSRPSKPKLKIIRETHSSETKNCCNRKRVALLLVAASFRISGDAGLATILVVVVGVLLL
ncbi:uncharacterized protein LOC141680951 [Apium graveolens]|uniref:uncharacterized protein LOC141680951 n=1 Tax=Apium graveolens TaxID=4045 RepID=UPI003D7A0AE9